MKKRDKLILTAGPSMSTKEEAYVLDAVRNGWNDQWNGYLSRLEKAFANFIGVKFAMATSSCTGALHVTLKGLGIQAGDEVLVPEITWVATAAAVTYVGAKPVFVDVDPHTLCMDPQSARKKITGKTKAIMPVHNYGQVCDMAQICRLAKEFKLFLIEDAAPALGATFNNQPVGSFGNAATFSFQGAKIITCGEGGMFLTNEEALYQRVKKINDHGRSLTKALWNDEIGHKYKMSNLQAALALAQFERLNEFISKKRQIFHWYEERLKDVEEIILSKERENSYGIYWMSTIILRDSCFLTREQFMKNLKDWNIDSRPVFYPLSSMPMFTSQSSQNPIAYNTAQKGINLPSGVLLEENDIDYICDIIHHILKKGSYVTA